MHDVRTFRAATMHEALGLVRRDMGLDAVVLQTKEIATRRFLRRRHTVEVTAGLGVNTATVDDGAAFGSPQQVSALFDRRSLAPRPDVGIDLLDSVVAEQAQSVPSHQAPLPKNPTNHGDATHNELLDERLATIEKLLSQFEQRTSGRSADSIPPELFHQYTRLIEADVSEAHARRIILELHERMTSGERTDDLDAQLASLIESRIRCSGPITLQRGRRKIVALVGPTGVGKTTTIAKLAANFRLRDGVKLGLVTVDTYRVAAVEQLRTYADIIELPMKVVTNPLEMRRAIDDLADMDLVLIDTAGRSPREELQLQELKALLGEARVDEVHLVMSLSTSPRVLTMTAERFAHVGVTSLILTKLDEAVGMGNLLGIAHDIDHPLSYFTTGQAVPDDIEIAQPAQATKLVLARQAGI